jgi:hypothetical protein
MGGRRRLGRLLGQIADAQSPTRGEFNQAKLSSEVRARISEPLACARGSEWEQYIVRPTDVFRILGS